jgi:hypothetical protein
MADPLDYVSALGRISGKLLSENLERQGVDLTFRNEQYDPDLLYLDVTNMRIGIEGAPPTSLARPSGSLPVYDLDVNDTIRTNYLTTDNQVNIDNLYIASNRTIGSTVGPINIQSQDVYSTIFMGEMTSDYLIFNDNYIESEINRNIRLDPNGTGRVVYEANTLMRGDLGVTGNILMSGNLRVDGKITVGDQQLDTVTIVPDFAQSIIPGDDDVWSLGENTGDSSQRRWAELHVPDLTQVTTMLPNSVIISEQTKIDGIANTIFALQSNENISLLPDTGIVYIEQTKWQDNSITNLSNTPLTLASTGIGYTRLVGTAAFVVPAGDDSTRRVSPEVGETRWSTNRNYLECFDGSIWTASIGDSGGSVVNQAYMEDLVNVYTLALG